MSLLLISNFAFGQTTYTWEGNNGTDWDDDGNWDPSTGHPLQNDNAVIGDPIVYGNNAIISGTGACNHITFYNDGIIFFAATGTNSLNVYGDIINYSNNTDIVGNANGTVIMRGSAAAVIDGTTPVELFNLAINKTNAIDDVVVLYKLRIKHRIQPIVGELYSGGYLTLVADLTNGTTAYSTPWTSASKIYEMATVEQRIPYTGLYYHYLSSPVSDADYNDYYTIGGQIADNATSANVYDWQNILINPNYPDYFLYDETACCNSTVAQVITHYQNELSVTLNQAEAQWAQTSYGWYCTDDLLSEELPIGTGVMSRVEFDTPGDIIDWSGYLNDGEVHVALTNTTCATNGEFGDGFNFVGNPYPSPINWTTLYNSDDNDLEVTPYAYVWTPDYDAETAFGHSAGDGYWSVLDADNILGVVSNPGWADTTGTANNYIGIGQGFVVEAIDDGMSFNNNCRVASNEPVILRESKPSEALQLLLESQSGHDYTNIYLSYTSTNEYNKKEDAKKMMNPKVNLATICGEKRLMINRLSKDQDEIEIPLSVNTQIGEIAKLSIGNAAFESNEYVAIFIDKKQQNQLLITKDFKYNCKIEKGEEETRFVIKFVKGNYNTHNISNTFGNVYVANAQLNIIANDVEIANITLTDASGRVVQQENVQFNSGKGLLNHNTLSNGIYIVNVQNATCNFNQKVYINK